MTIKITPKPWTVRKTSHGYVVEHNFKTADGQSDAVYIAVCANYSPNVDDEANGQFIAAAPEMLESLEKVVGLKDILIEIPAPLWQQIYDVIAKAKGETS